MGVLWPNTSLTLVKLSGVQEAVECDPPGAHLGAGGSKNYTSKGKVSLGFGAAALGS